MSDFSVVIPTLQRSRELRPLVNQLAVHPRVVEVLVINNAPQEISWDHVNVRVLNQNRNIFVNPAWNLGAAESRGRFLAIVNDDILFDDEVLTYGAKLLDGGNVGIVGPAPRALTPFPGRRLGHRMATGYSIRRGFGTCMMMRREDYKAIPDSLKIWGGDDWLFVNQEWPNQELLGTRFRTDTSVTSSAPEFQVMRKREAEEAVKLLSTVIGTRAWHDVAGRKDRFRVPVDRWRHRAYRLAERTQNALAGLRGGPGPAERS